MSGAPNSRSAARAMLVTLAAIATIGAARIEVSQHVRLERPADAIEFGKPFTLVVERRWSTDLRGPPWDDAQLAPLFVTETERAERVDADDDVVLQTIRFDAIAFERDVVRIGKPRWGATTADGAVIPAVGAELELRVTSALPADDAGVPELPGEPFPEPSSVSRWLVPIGVVAAALIAWLLRSVKRTRGTEALAVPDRREPWRSRIDGVDDAAPERSIERLARIVREAVASDPRWPALERTTEELTTALAADPAIEARAIESLRTVLEAADGVKFAERAVTRPDVVAIQAASSAFVDAWFAAPERRA